MEDLILQSNLPRNRVYKMICLPSIAKREGCALLQRAPAPSSPPVALPLLTDNSDDDNISDNGNEKIYIEQTGIQNDNPNERDSRNNKHSNNIDIKAILTALGGCVECPNDTIMNTMMITSCMMGPLYGVMRNNRDWLGEVALSLSLRAFLCS